MSSAAARPIFTRIEKKLVEALQPTFIKIVNESHLHAGHSGNPGGGPDAETHFRVEVISEQFAGKSMVARHRLVYDTLDGEMVDGGIHALALKTKTPTEMAKTSPSNP